MPQLEKGDCIRFEYRANNHENGVYEGHVTQMGPRRIVIKSNGNYAYISDPDQILAIVEKNKEDVIHSLGEEFRFRKGLGQDPIRPLED